MNFLVDLICQLLNFPVLLVLFDSSTVMRTTTRYTYISELLRRRCQRFFFLARIRASYSGWEFFASFDQTTSGKTVWNGHELGLGYAEKATPDPSLRIKYNLFLYSCLYFYVLTSILNFSYKVFKSFVKCKRVSKLAVIYTPSLRFLWTDQG